MTTNRIPKKLGATGLTRLAALVALAALGIPAHANTYLFSFTASQVMNALRTSQGTAAYNESAYFAIFVQPDPAVISGYTYQRETAPSDANPWTASTITDPSSPNLGYSSGAPCTSNCTWAEFYKGASQTSVTVISGANGGAGGTNIFLGTTWFSFSTPPYGWGLTTATISEIMPGASTFSFIINAPISLLAGTYNIKGYASDLQSGSPTTRTGDTKEERGLAFNLSANVTPISAVPDPSPALLSACGLAAIWWRRRRSSRIPSSN